MHKQLFVRFVVSCFLAASALTACNSGTTRIEVQDKNQVAAVIVETLVDGIDSGTGGLAIDSQGNLYTADFGWRLDGKGKGGNKIYKVDPAGNVSLFCDQLRGASGNALDSEGNLFQSNIGGGFISKINPNGEASEFARGAFKSPVGIAIDTNGNLFVCNCGLGSIVKVTPNGETSTFAKSKLLRCPNGIVQAKDGNFYVANFDNGDVIKIDRDGQASVLATLPGKNNGHLTYFNGELYVVARTANQIYKVTLDGQTSLFIGSGKRGKSDGNPLEATLSLPNDIGVSPDGQFMYVNETGPIEGDPRILGPTRIRRIKLRHSKPELSDQGAAQDTSGTVEARSNTIEQFAWIAGHWRGEAMGGSFEETWNTPMGNEMLGVFKFVKDDKIQFYEILTIVPDGNTFKLRLKHFDGSMVGWEEKDKSIEFPLQEITDSEVRFDGLSFKKINEEKILISVAVDKGSGDSETIRFQCQRVNRQSSGDAASFANSMQTVFQIDAVLAKQRDHLPKTESLSKAVQAYVLGLDSIDYTSVPAEFKSAFLQHRNAWEESMPFLQQHDNLRGEMHDLFDQIRKLGSDQQVALDRHVEAIMSTWKSIEEIAAKNGFNPAPANPDSN